MPDSINHIHNFYIVLDLRNERSAFTCHWVILAEETKGRSFTAQLNKKKYRIGGSFVNILPLNKARKNLHL